MSLGTLQKSWATAHPCQEPVSGELTEAAFLLPWQVSSGDGCASDPGLLAGRSGSAQLTLVNEGHAEWGLWLTPNLPARVQLHLSDLAQSLVSPLAPAHWPPMVWPP